MSVSAIIMAFLSIAITWGGFAYCLRIALKTNA
ncbi:MetS family NSS transporter small subunit [Vallitaleaceae bacterium 9-2]